MPTRQQRLAQLAYQQVSSKKGQPIEEAFARVCRSFPALIHNSGLCQAVAFAESKDQGKDKEFGQYLLSLSAILGIDRDHFTQESRTADVLRYQRLTHEALMAASWLKRYAEALLKDSSSPGNAENVQLTEEEGS